MAPTLAPNVLIGITTAGLGLILAGLVSNDPADSKTLMCVGYILTTVVIIRLTDAFKHLSDRLERLEKQQPKGDTLGG